MKALYIQRTVICKLKKEFCEILSAEVSYNFEHVIGDISDNKLNSYYFTLNESRIDLSQWMKNMVKIAIVCSLVRLPLKESDAKRNFIMFPSFFKIIITEQRGKYKGNKKCGVLYC